MSSLTMSELEAIAGAHSTRQASEVKANWRAIVEEARKQEVIVTNYNRPEAVVMSAERYAKLQGAARAKDPLVSLREEWDRRLAWLNEPGGRETMDEIFNSTPQQMADAANAELARKK
jgi:prevent-host-death family protein